MLKNLVLKIWKDSVGSQIIAAGLISIIILIVNSLFWSYRIELWIVSLIIVGLGVVQYLIFNKSKFFYDEETLELDRAFFNKIKTIATEEKMMPFKYYSFSGNPVLIEELHVIHEILEASKRSDFEFINPLLDALKIDLINEIEKFQKISHSYLFGAGKDWVAIPKEWEYTQPERFAKASAELMKSELSISHSYDKLIKTARRKLKI